MELFSKVRGSGPVLLVLPGGDGDADTVDALADHLVDDFTVVTYDRRGLSRSPAGTGPITVTTHSADASLLLTSITDEPAYVLGFSLGALVGLDLATGHPEQVKILVAHEPPLPGLLPEPSQSAFRAVQREIEDAFERDGIAAAMRVFGTLIQPELADREPDVILPAPGAGRAANLRWFLEHDAPAAHRYDLDVEALRQTRVVPAVGAATRDELQAAPALALARALQVAPVAFPGGHSGQVLRPKAFAARLREVLREHG